MYWHLGLSPIYPHFPVSFIGDEVLLPFIEANLFTFILNLSPFLVNMNFISSISPLFHLSLTSKFPSHFSYPIYKELLYIPFHTPLKQKKPLINYIHSIFTFSNHSDLIDSPTHWNLFWFTIPIKHLTWSSTMTQYCQIQWAHSFNLLDLSVGCHSPGTTS